MIRDKIQINILANDRNDAIIALLVANIAKTQISIEETLRMQLKLEYGNKITKKTYESEFKRVGDKFVELQYDLIADITKNYGCADSELPDKNKTMNEMLIEMISNFNEYLKFANQKDNTNGNAQN